MSQAPVEMGAVRQRPREALAVSRIGAVRRGATGARAPRPIGIHRTAAPTSRKDQIETTTNREVLAREGADFVGPMMPVRVADLLAPAHDRLVQMTTQALDRVARVRALMVHDTGQPREAEAPVGHRKRIMGQAAAALGAIATQANLVPTRRRAAAPIGHKALDPMAPEDDDDLAAMNAVPIDRNPVPAR